ncbi:MAG: hypothetical protein IT452_16625 [Planctomycetia bacterium]|nr:hypothetical protein [Planctomycetia bacterium]
MRRLRTLAAAGLLAALATGCGDSKGSPKPSTSPQTFMTELAGKRDHFTIVISGRLMAEVYPCG